jgi:membrane protein implicated in regulation of membrane protease activity
MLAQWIAGLGPWSWIILGVALLAAEILIPGAYLLWIGIAALLTGTLSFQLWEAGFWVWQVQVMVFLALTVLCAVAGKRVMRSSRGEESDQPLLNLRDQQLIGRTATLEEPISEGRGRVRIGDTTWRVSGPDLPSGTRVRVIASSNGDLTVEPL